MLDVIVVGAGACGVTAARTLADSGRSVAIVDGGNRDEHYRSLVPDDSFVHLRRTDPQQFRYILGDSFESITQAAVKTGAQLTPPRRFLVRDVERLLPVKSDDFAPLESLAAGGLAGGWGLGCAVFSDAELKRASLPVAEMNAAYQVIADRIGISGADDDARRYTSAHLNGIQPPLPIDPSAAVLLGNYMRGRSNHRARGFHAGRPALALLSESKDGRRACELQDMEFYADHGKSAWRAWIELDALRARSTVHYRPHLLVVRFEETGDCVTVEARETQSGELVTLRCRQLVLAAGALATGRIVLRSRARIGESAPLLCNPYDYLACLVPGRLGRAMPERNISLSQMAIFHDVDGAHRDVAMAFVYSYRALMLFRLARELPIPYDLAGPLLRFLVSGFLIVGIHQPHENNGGSQIRLQDAESVTSDALAVDFRLTPAEEAAVAGRRAAFSHFLRTVGAVPARTVQPGAGASIHYAGTIPYRRDEARLTCDSAGRLRETQRVYIADSSAFTFLPAKGVTLSAMAQAHRVAAAIPA